MKHRLAGLIASSVCIAIVMGMSSGRASAFPSPIETTKAEATSLRREIQANTEKMLVLAQRDHDAQLRLDDTRKRLAHITAGVAATRAAIEARRRAIGAANALQVQLLSEVMGQMAVLVEQEQAAAAAKVRSDAALAQMRREMQAAGTARPWLRARARAAVEALASRTPGVDPDNVPIPNVPALSLRAAAAVAYAKAQLGKPYRYAGVGPEAYDCSGLTMMAWAKGGVSMPHGSIAQGDMFYRVPDSLMEPGDLVIYYPDHHHVGMYVGDGMTISATHTGDYVRLQPVFRSGFQFAVRPGISASPPTIAFGSGPGPPR